jgi:hypothetical protein
MAYKVLGFIVWNGGRWYLRQRAPGAKGAAVLTGLTVAVGLGVLAAQRQRQHRRPVPAPAR